MAIPTENLSERYPIATDPYDSGDDPRFGQLAETAKDVFMKEIQTFFTYETVSDAPKLTEIPNVEKFLISTSGINSFASVMFNSCPGFLLEAVSKPRLRPDSPAAGGIATLFIMLIPTCRDCAFPLVPP